MPVQGQHYFRNLDWWFEEELLMGKDRLGIDDEVSDFREILGKYTRLMDHEYHLDQSTYLNDFDRSWLPSENRLVFRNQLRSIDRSHFATRSTLELDSPMEGRHDAIINMTIQDDRQRQRMIADIGYGYRFSEQQRLGVSMTVEQYKPDLDWTFFYEYKDVRFGQIDARIVFLDFVNNLIFDTIGVDPVLERRSRSYSSSPKLGAIKWNKYWKNWKIGLAGGFQNRSRATITLSGDRSLGGYNLYSEWLFTGMEIVFRSRLGETLFFATMHREKQSRENVDSLGDSDFSHLPTSNFSTGLKYWKASDSWSLSADFVYDKYENNWHSSDSPDSTRPGFRQQEIILQSEFRRSLWANRLVLAAGHAFQWRDLRDVSHINLTFAPNLFNSRSTASLGLRFRQDALIELGTSFDLDGDQFYTDRGPTRFDGAFGRVVYAMK